MALLPLPLIAGSYHSEPPPLPGSPGAAAAAARDAHGRVRELWDEYYDNFLGSENPFCVLSDDSASRPVLSLIDAESQSGPLKFI